MKKLLPILALLIPIFSFAQSNVSGKIVDSKTGTPIDITSIYTKSNGTISNELGEFVLRTDNDTLFISHLSYHPRKVEVTGEFLNIELEPKDITLDAAVIRPYAFLQGVLDKYSKNFYDYYGQGKEFPRATFYYRQTTSQDSLNTEFIECFFNGTASTAAYNLAIKQGRYARIEGKKRQIILLFNNAYIFSQFPPITTFEKLKKNTYVSPICPGSSHIFDIKLESLIEADTPNEIRVYRFTPKKKQEVKLKKIIGGSLHIRARDSSIVRFEGVSENLDITTRIGMKSLSAKLNFTVTYKDSEPFPIVESVKAQLQWDVKMLRKTYNVRVSTIMYATEYNINNSSDEDYLKGNLVKSLKDHEYDPSFWQDNPIIKRTPIENKIIEDFNKREYFGNFKL